MKKYWYLILVVFCLSLALFIYFISRNETETVPASSSSDSISSQVEWELGSFKNTDTTSVPGSLRIDNSGESEIECSNWYTDGTGNVDDIHDGTELGDGIQLDSDVAYDLLQEYVTCEFNASYKISRIRYWLSTVSDFSNITFYNGELTPWSEANHIIYGETPPDPPERHLIADWYTWEDYLPIEECRTTGDWSDCALEIPQTVNMVNFASHSQMNLAPTQELKEIEFYGPPVATHITAPTQIDGQEGDENKTLIEWTSFEATDNTPENTSITYEFRVSDDAENWTEWTSNFASLEDRRYLQVKATLTSNDGVSTPQIDDYTIKFHNNQKPNKPTAQTVIIGQ